VRVRWAVPATTDDRPLRRDARQNRQRVLDAAAAVFAERGLEAGVEEIARVAGVGMGTLYRRFPTKDALVCALVHDVMTTISRLARESTDCPDGTGLENFLEAASAYQAAHIGVLPRLWKVGSEHHSVDEIRRLVDALLADAKENGTPNRLVAFRMKSKGPPPRPHYAVWREGERTAFEVIKGDPKLVERCELASKAAQLRTASDLI